MRTEIPSPQIATALEFSPREQLAVRCRCVGEPRPWTRRRPTSLEASGGALLGGGNRNPNVHYDCVVTKNTASFSSCLGDFMWALRDRLVESWRTALWCDMGSIGAEGEQNRSTTHLRMASLLVLLLIACVRPPIARTLVSYDELALDSMNMVLYGDLADSNVNT